MAPQLPDSNTSLTYTAPSSLPHLTHTPLSPPAPNQVLVKLHAAAINPVDIQLWANPVLGWYAGTQEKGLGHDYAGEIALVGAAAAHKHGFRVGDAVFGLCNRPAGEGTFARYLAVDPDAEPIARKPATLSYAEAAALPLVVLTAFTMLEWLPAAVEGGSRRRVVVAGASGGVGMWVVQLAKKVYDCYVVGICSGRNAAFVTGLGADEVLDYGEEDVREALLARRPGGRKFDLYADCVGGTDVFAYWHDLLHTSGAYITIVGDKTSRTAMGGPVTYLTHPAQVLRHIRGYFFGPRYANVLLSQKTELLERVSRLAEEGEVQVVVQDVVQGILSEDAHKEAWEKLKGYMTEGRVRGKIVVDIA